MLCTRVCMKDISVRGRYFRIKKFHIEAFPGCHGRNLFREYLDKNLRKYKVMVFSQVKKFWNSRQNLCSELQNNDKIVAEFNIVGKISFSSGAVDHFKAANSPPATAFGTGWVFFFNPSYIKLFRTHTFNIPRGGGGMARTPTIPSTLSCINIKFCRIYLRYQSKSHKIKSYYKIFCLVTMATVQW